MIDFDRFQLTRIGNTKKHVWQEKGVTAAKDRLIKQYWLCQDFTLLLLYCNCKLVLTWITTEYELSFSYPAKVLYEANHFKWNLCNIFPSRERGKL